MRYFIFRKRVFFAKNYPASFAIFTDSLNELKTFVLKTLQFPFFNSKSLSQDQDLDEIYLT